MDIGPFAVIGRIVKTHGLKGEVSVVPVAEASFSSLIGASAWIVPPPESVRTTRISSVRRGPKGEIVGLEGVNTIDAAYSLVNREILVKSEELSAEWLGALQHEDDEVIGLSLSDTQHGLLGEVVDVIITGANDVWVVEGPFGEVLVPVIDEVVGSVDLKNRTAIVTLLPGLLPNEDEIS